MAEPAHLSWMVEGGTDVPEVELMADPVVMKVRKTLIVCPVLLME